MSQSKRFYVIVGCVLVLLFVLLFNGTDINTENYRSLVGALQKTALLHHYSQDSKNTTKWIVITSIAYPTEAVKALAATPGWRVVVVADTKTPVDWKYDNCDFLSLDKQHELKYAISKHIPFRSYTRKMFGYLYAIQNGAEWIYDTDDDNQPIGEGLAQFDAEITTKGLTYGLSEKVPNKNATIRKLFNPYEFWGQKTIWPRGFPLENIQEQNDPSAFFLCDLIKTPAIQQGLVTKDPDVDAIYRLLQADKVTGLNVNFNAHTPPITLNARNLCPFNSQNTLFHRDAFWSLFLPVSVAFRVTDIWRGYFAQKLLHLTGNKLGFYPANAIQKRNAHSYFADFKDEGMLYNDAGRLVDFLSNWTCNHSVLFNCIIQLSSDFVDNNFWSSTDSELTKAWIEDLQALNYTFPKISADSKEESQQSSGCRKVYLDFSAEKTHRSSTAQISLDDLEHWCRAANSSISACGDKKLKLSENHFRHLKSTALIIVSTTAFHPSLSIYQRIYDPFFATVVFCGPVEFDQIMSTSVEDFPPVQSFNYINVTYTEIDAGRLSYLCPAKAIELRLQNLTGYVVISLETLYNFWNELKFDKFWVSLSALGKNGVTINGNTTTNPAPVILSIDKALKSLQLRGFNISRISQALIRQTLSNGSSYQLPHVNGDFYVIPKAEQLIFYNLAHAFHEQKLEKSITLALIGKESGFDWSVVLNDNGNAKEEYDLNFKLMTQEESRSWMQSYSSDLIYINPISISRLAKDISARRSFCDSFINSYKAVITASQSNWKS